MYIVLVEDEDPKLTHIKHYIKSLLPDSTLVTARSVNSAIDCIEEHTPDLVIIDMSLPTFEVGGRESGGRPQPFGGVEILRHMALSKVRCSTIVLTGYEAFKKETGKSVNLEQLSAELTEEFGPSLIGVLRYNSTYDQWKNQLASAFSGLATVQRSED
jgi:CheY-like chemotaxis protein